MNRLLTKGVRTVRRVVIAVVGTTVALVGIALLVLPGPAVVVFPIGIGILALEFTWARRLLTRARELFPLGIEPGLGEDAVEQRHDSQGNCEQDP